MNLRRGAHQYSFMHIFGRKMQCMFDIILTAADEICPMVNMKIRNGNPEWFSKEILNVLNVYMLCIGL